MRVRGSLLCLFGMLTQAVVTAQRVDLETLAALAKERATAQQAAFQATLQPFLQDFALGYNDNRRFLDERIDTASQLGDGVVPALLERLVPAEDSASARNVAANSARVLAKLEPASFVDALLELLTGKSAVARSHAIALLGDTDSPQAGAALALALPELSGDALISAIHSLRRLESSAGVARLLPMLATAEPKVRDPLLAYFHAIRAKEALPAVRALFAKETRKESLPLYFDYFGDAARGDAGVAEALLARLATGDLDRGLENHAVRTLGKVAPQMHAPTVAALRAIVPKEATSALGRHAVLALKELGDKRALDTWLDAVDDALKKRKRDSLLLEVRGDVYFEMGRIPEAIRDYEESLNQIRINIGTPQAAKTMQVSAYFKLMRCEAQRERWPRVLKYLKDSEITFERFVREAAEDPLLRRAMQEKSIQKYLDTRK